MRRLAPLLALLVLPAAGCGGTEKPPRNAAEFRTQVDVVCKATLDSAGDIRNGSLTAPKLAADVSEALKKLRDLKAPEAVAGDFQGYLKLLDEERAALAARDGDRGRTLEQRANEAASELGLARCRQPPFERGAPE